MDDKRDENTNIKNEIIEWIKAIVIAVAAVFIIKFFLFDVILIDGTSMEPTLHNRDRVFVNILGYKVGKPKHNDVIIFTPSIDKNSYYIKRVIGLPGDTVEIKNDRVFLNGELLDETYLAPGTVTRPFTEETLTIKVPEGTVFVLGDNRGGSEDSRDPRLGPVPIKSIKGRAVFRLYPFNDIKKISYNSNSIPYGYTTENA